MRTAPLRRNDGGQKMVAHYVVPVKPSPARPAPAATLVLLRDRPAGLFNDAGPYLRQATHGGGGLAGPATDEATRACLGPPTVPAGPADPATDEATRACLGPPTVHAGLADPATDEATRACLGPPTVPAGLVDPPT